MRTAAVVLAAMLLLTPLGARAADLVVWWEKGYYAQEDEALREIIAAFEQKTGKQVELVLPQQAELPDKLEAALKAGQPPDFTFGLWLDTYIPRWALEDRLVDLTDAVGSFSNLFDPNQLDRAMLLNAKTGQRALYGLPMGQIMRSHPRLEEPAGGRGLLARRHPQGVGWRSGRSGATGCSRPCAGPAGATTSGASAWPCRRWPPTLRISSSSSSPPTMRTT